MFFIATSSHLFKLIESIFQSFGFQRREIIRNQSNVPKIVRCQTKERNICWLPNNYHVQVKNPGGKND